MDIKPEIIEAVKKAAKEGRLACAVARKMADEFKVPPLVIGQACDQLGIKIKACELGCF